MRHRAIAAIAVTLAGGAAIAAFTATAGGVTAAHEYNHVLQVVLSGRGGGDTDGFGTFSGVLKGRQLCYGIETVGITPVAAHIHKGGPKSQGPVVVPLEPTGVKADAPTVGAACTTLSKAMAAALVKEPGKYYVNVHTADFPNGAIRGQLAHPPKG
jgi:hypothetical protein